MVEATHRVAVDRRAQRAIVLGVNDHPRALAAVRSLGRAGIPVIGVRSRAFARCHSRFLTHTHVVEPTDGALLPFLDSLANDGAGVLFAVHDKYLVLASRHADLLCRRFTLTMPPWEILGRLMDPRRLYDIAGRQGVRTPVHFVPADEADLERIVARLDFAHCEYVLKTTPGIAAEPADPATGRSIKRAGSDPSMVRRNCLEIHARLGRFPMIAEIVPGQANQCVAVTMLVDRNRAPVLAFCTDRLGSNVSCESTQDDEALEAATRLLNGADYAGLVTLEFRRDPRDRKLTLIKADPRVIRPTSLSTALGMDTPTALYRFATGSSGNQPAACEQGAQWLSETTLFETLWDDRDARPLGAELHGIWRRRSRIKAFAYFSLRDPLPFLVHAQWRWRSWLGSRFHGLARRAADVVRRRRTRADALDV